MLFHGLLLLKVSEELRAAGFQELIGCIRGSKSGLKTEIGSFKSVFG